MISGWGTWAGVAALVWATNKGRETFKDYRTQRQTERQFDAAERILTAAYRARDAIYSVRSPLVEAAEFHRAKEVLLEQGLLSGIGETQQKKLTHAQVYYNRLNQFGGDFEALWEVMPTALAHFGDEVYEALKDIAHKRRLIQVAADATLDDDGSDVEFGRSIRADLSRAGKHDKLGEDVDEKVKLLDETLLPILRNSEEKSPKG